MSRRGVGDALLTLGQFVSVLGCLGSLYWAVQAVLVLAMPPTPQGTNAAMVVVGAALAFLYSAAMFEVFTRVKRLPPT
jgi:hypothetical protein